MNVEVGIPVIGGSHGLFYSLSHREKYDDSVRNASCPTGKYEVMK
jgi:hypothetical protein